MDWFWVDENNQILKTYTDLINDINNKKTINTYISDKNPYNVFLELICSLLMNVPVEIVDNDLSVEEKQSLGILLKQSDAEKCFKMDVILTKEALLNAIRDKHEGWSASLYTSGTTGRPKKIAQTFASLTKKVKKSEKFSDDVWGFSYHPTHFAGLQVFFQALLNSNAMIYIFEEKREQIEGLLNKYNVTHISATPTFYRTIIPYIDNPIHSVQRVTLGGEKFDVNLSTQFNKYFPNAKVRNVYASTEAGSLFESDNNFFRIKEEIKSYIRIAEDGELLLSDVLLGNSEDLKVVDGWYYTGDVIRFISDDTIEFTGRKTEMINVGGYKVNPQEIEEEIKKIDGIYDVNIRGRANKLTGNILIADIVKSSDNEELNEMLIYSILKEKLQVWKIPRMINFVTDINKTRTGKKVRV